MAPAISERNSRKFQPRRPDRSELVQHGGQDRGCGKRAAIRLRRDVIEQAARPRRVVRAEHVRSLRHQLAQTPQQIGTSFEPEQRIGIAHLKGWL
ncbi:hypothetical protein ACVW0I_007240 [Bradyrhizobium sp. LM6.11]